MKRWLLIVSGWVLGTAGLCTFGYSLVKQTQIQKQMNMTMRQINQSVTSTSRVVGQTSDRLHPLVTTTKALNNVLEQEVSATNHLSEMNGELRSVAKTEQSLIDDLDALNQSIVGVSDSLGTMQNLNQQILSASLSASAQGTQESHQLHSLNTMTSTSISQLHKLNQKFAALGILP